MSSPGGRYGGGRTASCAVAAQAKSLKNRCFILPVCTSCVAVRPMQW
jgi:hypothetical protein